jgi:glycosyltransferase involved in cell wall biosynthesis
MIIANSNAGAAYHMSTGFPENRMRVVENSVDTNRFTYSEKRRTAFRQSRGILETQRIVLIPSRIDSIKGYDIFLAAAANVARARSDVLFWSMGGGDAALHAALRDQARAYGLTGRLEWFGEVKEPDTVVSILCASDVCVSAAMSEGFPNSVAESLACGLRVVATDVGDTRRLIGPCGECVPVGDAGAMSAAVLREIAREPMRDVVRRDFMSRFEPHTLMSRHEELLLQVAKTATR